VITGVITFDNRGIGASSGSPAGAFSPVKTRSSSFFTRTPGGIRAGKAFLARLIKVDPSFILNASAGYALAVGSVVVRPQVYVENVFDHKYLLKGAFFSGASVGRPRSVQLRVNIGA